MEENIPKFNEERNGEEIVADNRDKSENVNNRDEPEGALQSKDIAQKQFESAMKTRKPILSN